MRYDIYDKFIGIEFPARSSVLQQNREMTSDSVPEQPAFVT